MSALGTVYIIRELESIKNIMEENQRSKNVIRLIGTLNNFNLSISSYASKEEIETFKRIIRTASQYLEHNRKKLSTIDVLQLEIYLNQAQKTLEKYIL